MSGRLRPLAARILLVGLLATLAGSAKAEPLGPGSKLCLYPVTIPIDEDEGADRRDVIEKKLIAALEAASFELADPVSVRELADRVKTESGGWVDPVTGRRDESRHRAFRANLATALREDLECDAQLVAQVVPVRASFNNGMAKWDGTSDQVSSTGRIVLNLLAGVSESGWIGAFSLRLWALDLEGDDLAFRSAGIEALVELAVWKDKDFLPEDHWLTDEVKIDAAIQSALGPAGRALRERGDAAGADAALAAKRR
jgi:hypothetical protein